MSNLIINLSLSVIFGLAVLIFLIKKSSLKIEEILIFIITGLCVVFPASIIEYRLAAGTSSITGFPKLLINAFLIAALIEESLKFFVIKLLITVKKIEPGKKIIAAAVAAGTGFACLENVMYSFDSSMLVIFRIFSAIPLHIITAGIIGVFLAQTGESRQNSNLRGFAEAFILHGLYNLLISLKSYFSLLALLLIFFAAYRLYFYIIKIEK